MVAIVGMFSPPAHCSGAHARACARVSRGDHHNFPNYPNSHCWSRRSSEVRRFLGRRPADMRLLFVVAMPGERAIQQEVIAMVPVVWTVSGEE